MKDFTKMSDQELFEEYIRLGRNQMYYMAAEGNWNSETDDRKENEKEYYACQSEFVERGLNINDFEQ